MGTFFLIVAVFGLGFYAFARWTSIGQNLPGADPRLLKSILISSLVLLVISMLSGCAQAVYVEPGPKVYGFFSGFWHGLIVFFSFLASLFNDNIAIYAVNNTGGWYDFGFLLGIGAFGGGAASR